MITLISLVAVLLVLNVSSEAIDSNLGQLQIENASKGSSLSQVMDVRLPKCLSFEDSNACENIHSFYKTADTNREPMQLDNIVFVMMMHNDVTVDDLIEAHFRTWIRRLGPQTDIVFVTDDDDT